MRIIHQIMTLAISVTLLASCSTQDDSQLVAKKGETVVNLTIGKANILSRAAFNDEEPVSIYVYKRNEDDSQNFNEVYKTVTGKTSNQDINGLSPIVLDGSTKFTVESGNSYDFVLLVNQPSSAELSGGVLSKISNGYDLLAGRADNVEVPVSVTSQTVNVAINDGGANDGDLPHLCSALNIEVSANQDLIDGVGGGNLSLGLVSAAFKKMGDKATLDFSQSPMALSTTVSDASIVKVANTEGGTQSVTQASQKLSYDGGFILPMALAAGESKNKIDIDFVVKVNDREKTISLTDVEVPAFESGKRYTFHLTVNGSIANLTATVKAWETKDWNSSMGGTNLDTGQND